MKARYHYPNGPGKYDNECEVARELTGAAGVLLIVFNGNRGSGFSATITDPAILQAIPAVLRSVADDIEAQQRGGMQ